MEFMEIEEIVQKIDNLYTAKQKILKKLIDYLKNINIDYALLKSLKYNNQNKFFFDFNENLKNIKVYVIRWDKYVNPHDHNDSGCIFKLLYGKLQSRLYSTTMAYKDTIVYHENMCDYIDNEIGYHDMENINFYDYSYSIHIYSKNYVPSYHNKPI